MKLEELLESINKQTVRTKQWDDPHYLRDLLLTLASYYSSLGEPLALAEQDSALAENHYKVVKAQTIKDKVLAGTPITRAEEEVVLEIQDDKLNHIALSYKARRLFLTRQNLDKTMDGIRSSLSYIKSDKEGARDSV